MSSPSERPQARVLALISQLLRRPARTDRRLPLIWLNGGGDGTRVLGALVAQLTPPVRYRVPHAYVDMTETGRTSRHSSAAAHGLRAVGCTAVR